MTVEASITFPLFQVAPELRRQKPSDGFDQGVEKNLNKGGSACRFFREGGRKCAASGSKRVS